MRWREKRLHACNALAKHDSLTHTSHAHAAASNLTVMLSLRLHAVMMSTSRTQNRTRTRTHTRDLASMRPASQPPNMIYNWMRCGRASICIRLRIARISQTARSGAAAGCWWPSPLWKINCRQHIEWNWPHRVPPRCVRTLLYMQAVINGFTGIARIPPFKSMHDAQQRECRTRARARTCVFTELMWNLAYARACKHPSNGAT